MSGAKANNSISGDRGAAAAEMLNLLEELSCYTRKDAGAEAGVTRVLYSPEWAEAQRFLMKRMEAFGLCTYADSVGNIYGRLEGVHAGPVVLSGSHIDTVMNGGKYDGAYGVAAAVTALHYLKQTYGPPLRSLEAVSFAEEEGSRFPLTFWGSGNVTGLYNEEMASQYKDQEGITLKEAMLGHNLGEQKGLAFRQDVAAYVELHIEQGMVLEQSGTQIGVVEAITGQRRASVTIKGRANHAGTTPMGMRKDALAAAAEMVLAIEAAALKQGDPLVATVGKLEVMPNTSNVIPGEVCFSLDIRHPGEDVLKAFCMDLERIFAEISATRGVLVELKHSLQAASSRMDPGLCRELSTICSRRGLTWRRMVSGAGHDAQLFAPSSKAAMIFVPSREGISHAPEEFTSPEELVAGLEVLIELLYKLGYEEEAEEAGV